MKLKKPSILMLTTLTCSLSSAQPTETLETIVVSSQNDEIAIQDQKVGETRIGTERIRRQQMSDSRDLVRYETGVTVVEKGRFGASGYAIRGVDENRVGIMIDGLHQAETLSSQGFKELFEGYGNFNNTRNGVEMETLKQANIQKGANSIKTGSGALGGSVIFQTKDARDFLINKNWFVSYKKGYSTADNQHLSTLTLAGKYKSLDVLLVSTTRKGHEVENYGYKSYNERIQGRTREKADPYHRTLDSKLIKIGFQPNENHRFSVMADLYQSTSKGHDFSYTLKPNTQYQNYDEVELRHTNDKVERTNYAFSYENYSINPFYDTLKLTYSNQHINTRARTDDYCHGNDKCPDQGNPLGMKYNEENKLVGNDGIAVNYLNRPKTQKPSSDKMIDLPVTPFDGKNSPLRWKRVNWDNLPLGYIVKPGYKSCEDEFSSWNTAKQPKINDNSPCKATLTMVGSMTPAESYLKINNQTYDLLSKHKDLITDNQIIRTSNSAVLSCDGLNCNHQKITAFKDNGETIEVPFKVIERNGKKFAYIKGNGGDQLKSPKLFVPNKKGHLDNLWTQRDLITDTKQLNLDLTKYVELGKTQHNLAYGGLWSKTTKSMINTTGQSALNVKWWALYPTDCSQKIGSDGRYNALCNHSNVFSFLIPVKATTKALYFEDDIRVNDYFAFGFAYRYDRIQYKPEYIPGVTPKVPSDMVTNLYVTEPKFDPSKFSDTENEKLRVANANANMKHIAQAKKYSASSYTLTTTVDPFSWFRIQAKYSNGFRAPTGEEIYLTFKHPDFSILPNKNLEAETAKTKEVALTFHNPRGFITTSLFHTKYDNFIDLAFIGNKQLHGHSKLVPFSVYQNINRQHAKVTGLDINAKLKLDVFTSRLEGFKLGYKFTYQRGRINGDIPMNAIQPKTSVFSAGYDHKSGKFGLDIYLTHVSEKKAKDTYNMFWKTQQEDEHIGGRGIITTDSSVRWRSNAYTLVDMVMYAKPIKNLTLQFGVYNLTNRKYITWDSARSIRPFGTSNMIDKKTGEGINRFNAPGRNFKLNAELTF
ncbi:TPA: TonB-dependent hemoglobin/transferrin/lactoferrin family receptor [Pasteurella multocida]|uniref:TonB-dependent hemoglobin/transferrin/lactoferrin family receptor n=7 Tax=Pasteurella multocida TaxID=747 RepID=UPI0003AD7C8E|nr:TonB-dependent hemoglobin/transferrin/lactoferrin family receptor [Pasteurella multocida]ERL42575.1 TonB-dependent hemoglobin/transferrin/lactoferrin receptor family protein [Pasteurella multocida subsp. multocida str. PMTB]KEZ10649.1 ligand-gated channel protein [Pasteurella multocida]KEZ10702.1 ligand-gated channel protein [Pasteurella multocida]MEE3703696.1 TonB-dependent hemoglobin/transferrin/lactoferrin family receptor [Pasteurella multocida]MEE3779195.1 TonB-dependent hemoglobin/tran